MRNRVVPHFGHLPFIAGFPFFSFTFFGSAISRFARHFTQYAWTMGGSPWPRAWPARRINIWVPVFFERKISLCGVRGQVPSPHRFYWQDLYNVTLMQPRGPISWPHPSREPCHPL